MGKKMKVPFLSKNKKEEDEAPRHSHPWQWALCKQPKTLSFRAKDNVFKTVNSVFFGLESDSIDTPESISCFTNSSLSAHSFSTQSEDKEEPCKLGSIEEVIISGAQSNRLFFEPAGDSRSILKEGEKAAAATSSSHNDHHKVLFKESSVALAMESEDPYEDFKRSMEQMVESYGLKDWECLEELLGWYLKVNGKKNHGFIVGAFVDLLVSMGGASSSSSSAHSPSPSSSSSSSHSPSPSSTSSNKSNSGDASTSFSSADTSFSSPSSSPPSPPGKEEEITGKTIR